jgi:hypothetical protein
LTAIKEVVIHAEIVILSSKGNNKTNDEAKEARVAEGEAILEGIFADTEVFELA